MQRRGTANPGKCRSTGRELYNVINTIPDSPGLKNPNASQLRTGFFKILGKPGKVVVDTLLCLINEELFNFKKRRNLAISIGARFDISLELLRLVKAVHDEDKAFEKISADKIGISNKGVEFLLNATLKATPANVASNIADMADVLGKLLLGTVGQSQDSNEELGLQDLLERKLGEDVLEELQCLVMSMGSLGSPGSRQVQVIPLATCINELASIHRNYRSLSFGEEKFYQPAPINRR